MSFSITVKLDAWGLVQVDVVDQAGGCPFTIAGRIRTPEDLTGLTLDQAADRFGDVMWSPHAGEGWKGLGVRADVVKAVRALAMCLPPPEVFDDDGRPKLVAQEPRFRAKKAPTPSGTTKRGKPIRLMTPRELQAFAREAARFFTEIGERARAEHPEQYGLKAKPKAKRKRKP